MSTRLTCDSPYELDVMKRSEVDIEVREARQGQIGLV